MRRWRVCVTGGRDFTDRTFVWRGLNRFEAERGEIIELGEGEARGVDTLCREWAEAAGIPVRKYAADWDRWGDAAGSIRNGEMLRDFRPAALLAFPGGIGTADCIRQARKLKIERVLFNLTDDPFEDAATWG